MSSKKEMTEQGWVALVKGIKTFFYDLLWKGSLGLQERIYLKV